MTATWTTASIYKAGHTWMPDVVDARTVTDMPYLFTADFLAAFRAEKQWRRGGSPQTHADLSKVAWGKQPCPVCGSEVTAGTIRVHLHGRETGIECSALVDCTCAAARAIAAARAVLPVSMRRASLAKMSPTATLRASETRQREIIGRLRGYDGNVILYGPANTGKSHYAAGIYLDAVRTWASRPGRTTRPAIYIDAATMLDEWMAYNKSSGSDDSPVVVPTVTLAKIKAAAAAGYSPLLVLDDMDLVKMTEPKLVKLLSILKELKHAGGRVVMTTSIHPEQLAKRWSSVPGSETLVDWMHHAMVASSIGKEVA